jgi:hypothetical protein
MINQWFSINLTIKINELKWISCIKGQSRGNLSDRLVFSVQNKNILDGDVITFDYEKE